MPSARSAQIEQNYSFFQGFVSTLISKHAGEYALLHDQKVVAIYPSVAEAVNEGQEQFDDGIFSVQEVTDTPLDLGFFSHANPIG